MPSTVTISSLESYSEAGIRTRNQAKQCREAILKKCGRCQVEKPRDAFYKHSGKHDGLQGRCKECTTAHNKSWYAGSDERRDSVKARRVAVKTKNQALVNRFKSFYGCSHCGERDVIVLDLHHRDPAQKDAHIAELMKCSMKALRDEIRKCMVLCANCHRREHHRLRQEQP